VSHEGKAAAVTGTETASKTTPNSTHSSIVDPQRGWFALASNVKPSRKRQQKRGWQRGAKR